ncbi:hypothetical protein [Enterococcus sp. 665A]|nr:hypothetical protein [Enterococcus sp. 665A]
MKRRIFSLIIYDRLLTNLIDIVTESIQFFLLLAGENITHELFV